MLNIEWRHTKHRYNDKMIDALVIDGTVYNQSYKSEDDEYGLGCFVREEQAIEILLNEKVVDLGEQFDFLSLEMLGAEHESEGMLAHALPFDRFHFNFSYGVLYLVYDVYFGSGERAARYLANFKAQLAEVLRDERYADQLAIEEESSDTEISLEFEIADGEAPARQPADDAYALAKAVLAEACDRIWEERPQQEVLMRRFDLTPEVKSACEQYLVYFSQFLADLGIKASASLSSEPGGVLFTVRPDSREEALESIRDALDIYLFLPWDEAFDRGVIRLKDPAVQQLVIEVHTLRGKLALAELQLEAQRTTAEHLRLSNAILQRALGNNALGGESGERVDICGGLVTLKPIEFPGFTANLPELWKRIPGLLNRLRRNRAS